MRRLLLPSEILMYTLGVLFALLIALAVAILYPFTLGKSAKWAEKYFSQGLPQ